MTALARVPEPRISASGLPAWTCLVLDALLASGVVTAGDLEGLDSDALVGMAICWTRSLARAEQVDGSELVEAARAWIGPTQRRRHAAA